MSEKKISTNEGPKTPNISAVYLGAPDWNKSFSYYYKRQNGVPYIGA
jgi:hypothetical protein